MFKAVIFDIDGTLTEDRSWVRMTEGVGGSVLYNNKTFKNWREGKITEKETHERLISNWSLCGKGFYKDIFSILNKTPFRPDVKETIKYLKDKGYLVCAITGSFDTYAKIICEELEIPSWFAITKLIWDEDGKLIDLETVKDDEAKLKKIDFFKQYCLKNNLQHSECVPVGDSENDTDLFKLTKNGVAIRTEFEKKELEQIAWKKIDHLIQLKEIL